MILGVIFIFILVAISVAVNKNNKYAAIISLHFVSVGAMIIVGLIYLSKVSQYHFPLKIEYAMYLALYSIKISIKDVSRLYNIVFAIFMLSSVIYTFTVSKKASIVCCIVSVFFTGIFLWLNDYNTSYNLYLNDILNGYDFFYRNYNYINYIIIFYHFSAPVIAFILSLVRSKIFIRKVHLFIILICFLLLNEYVYFIFIKGVFSTIFFSNVNMQKIPFEIAVINNYIFPTATLFGVISIISFLLVKTSPFGMFSFASIRDNMRVAKLFRKNLGMIMHVYKNAFIAAAQRFYLINDSLEKEKYDLAKKNSDMGIETVDEYLHFLDDMLKILKTPNEETHNISVKDCIDKAVKTAECENITNVICDDKIVINANKHQITEVFVNLLLNSKTALENTNNPNIVINVVKELGFCMVSVKDNGVGIDKKDIKDVFEMFYSTKKQQCGGIGLSYVKNVMQRCGGNVRVLSKKDKFTLFELVFKAK